MLLVGVTSSDRKLFLDAVNSVGTLVFNRTLQICNFQPNVEIHFYKEGEECLTGEIHALIVTFGMRVIQASICSKIVNKFREDYDYHRPVVICGKEREENWDGKEMDKVGNNVYNPTVFFNRSSSEIGRDTIYSVLQPIYDYVEMINRNKDKEIEKSAAHDHLIKLRTNFSDMLRQFSEEEQSKYLETFITNLKKECKC